MNVSPLQKTLINVRKIAANHKAAEFARTTVYTVAVETTLKATGRPAFIYFDKNANKQSKKYAATKEFLYQFFSLGLYLGLITKFKNITYNIISKKFATQSPENKRKIDLYNDFQNKIKKANKIEKKKLENQFTRLLKTNKDYHFGKGVKEFSSIISSVIILGLCAPVLSQLILHPVMDTIFKKENNNKH